MSKNKIPATGEGYLGEIMVHKISRVVGVVEGVAEARAGWPPQITLKLKDGSFKKRQAKRLPRTKQRRAGTSLCSIIG